MKHRYLTLPMAVIGLLALTACGEPTQDLVGAGVKQDGAPHAGVGASQYAAPGWKAGDRNGWEQQLRTRAAYGQNEYTRVGN